jgi:hypothetical protein
MFIGLLTILVEAVLESYFWEYDGGGQPLWENDWTKLFYTLVRPARNFSTSGLGFIVTLVCFSLALVYTFRHRFVKGEFPPLELFIVGLAITALNTLFVALQLFIYVWYLFWGMLGWFF